MNLGSLGFLTSFRRSTRAPGSHFSPPTWRRVEAGPLAGLEFFLHRGHGGSLGDRIVAGTYEPELIAFIVEGATRGGCLYDVGAHVGYVSCAWLHLGGDRAEAFEPVETNAQIITETAARNRLPALCVHQVALASADSQGRMRVNETNLSTSSMAYLEGAGGVDERTDSLEYANARTTPVPIRSLDSICAEKMLPPPAVIKVDVEGAEGHVIGGAVETLHRYQPLVICELHNVESAVDVAAQLTTIGYSPRLLLRQKQTIRNYVWAPATKR
jgi:FkbM family methyltransferase